MNRGINKGARGGCSRFLSEAVKPVADKLQVSLSLCLSPFECVCLSLCAQETGYDIFNVEQMRVSRLFHFISARQLSASAAECIIMNFMELITQKINILAKSKKKWKEKLIEGYE